MLRRLFLVTVLLVAQHSALAHGIWHVAGASAAYGAGSATGGPQSGSDSALCEQHEALGSVLGGLGSADACELLAPQQADAITGAVQSSANRAPLSPSSRDPPKLR